MEVHQQAAFAPLYVRKRQQTANGVADRNGVADSKNRARTAPHVSCDRPLLVASFVARLKLIAARASTRIPLDTLSPALYSGRAIGEAMLSQRREEDP